MALGEPDKSGRRRPEPMPGSEFTIAADTLILAVGQEVDGADLEDVCELTSRGTIAADKLTLLTSRPGVFAGGDCETGPATVVEAIAAGRRAAVAIDAFVSGRSPRRPARRPGPGWNGTSREFFDIGAKPLSDAKREPTCRCCRCPARRNFDEVELGFDEAAASKEAARCLQCTCHEASQPASCSSCPSAMARAPRSSRATAASSTCSTAAPILQLDRKRCIQCHHASGSATRWSSTASTKWTTPDIRALKRRHLPGVGLRVLRAVHGRLPHRRPGQRPAQARPRVGDHPGAHHLPALRHRAATSI